MRGTMPTPSADNQCRIPSLTEVHSGVENVETRQDLDDHPQIAASAASIAARHFFTDGITLRTPR